MNWSGERETNEYWLYVDPLDMYRGVAYVARDGRAKCWRYFVSIGRKTVDDGQGGNLEDIMRKCEEVLTTARGKVK